MQLYRFSPIQDSRQLFEAVVYVATTATMLCKKIVDNEYPITNLTVFSHYSNEFTFLSSLLQEHGTIMRNKNGPVAKLHTPITVGSSTISILRVRNPDPYRSQVGCCDFAVDDFQNFKETFLTNGSRNLRSIPRTEYEMIEFFDPDVDVLAYVLSVSLYS